MPGAILEIATSLPPLFPFLNFRYPFLTPHLYKEYIWAGLTHLGYLFFPMMAIWVDRGVIWSVDGSDVFSSDSKGCPVCVPTHPSSWLGA